MRQLLKKTSEELDASKAALQNSGATHSAEITAALSAAIAAEENAIQSAEALSKLVWCGDVTLNGPACDICVL